MNAKQKRIWRDWQKTKRRLPQDPITPATERAIQLQIRAMRRAEIIARKEADMKSGQPVSEPIPRSFMAGTLIEICTMPDGTLDEIFGRKVDVHLEQMSRDLWWMGIYDGQGRTVHLTFSTANESIRGVARFEGVANDKPNRFSTRATRPNKFKKPNLP